MGGIILFYPGVACLPDISVSLISSESSICDLSAVALARRRKLRGYAGSIGFSLITFSFYRLATSYAGIRCSGTCDTKGLDRPSARLTTFSPKF